MTTHEVTERTVPFKADVRCEACGQFGAYEFDGHRLCADCYGNRCSCCPEFEREEEAEG